MLLEKILKYNNLSIIWINKSPNNKDTKFGYAIEKVSKPIIKLLKPINELNEERDILINDLNADNALTNPTTGAFVYDIIKDKDGNDVQKFQYSPVTRKKRDSEIRIVIKKYEKDLEDLLSKEIEFDKPYYASEIPPNLTDEEREAFIGIIIKP